MDKSGKEPNSRASGSIKPAFDRKRSKARETGTREALEALPAADDSGERSIDDAARLLDREIEKLPLRQRTVFTLSVVEGFSLEETARILGLKGGTARYHLFMARDRLRERLGPFMDAEQMRIEEELARVEPVFRKRIAAGNGDASLVEGQIEYLDSNIELCRVAHEANKLNRGVRRSLIDCNKKKMEIIHRYLARN